MNRADRMKAVIGTWATSNPDYGVLIIDSAGHVIADVGAPDLLEVVPEAMTRLAPRAREMAKACFNPNEAQGLSVGDTHWLYLWIQSDEFLMLSSSEPLNPHAPPLPVIQLATLLRDGAAELWREGKHVEEDREAEPSAAAKSFAQLLLRASETDDQQLVAKVTLHFVVQVLRHGSYGQAHRYWSTRPDDPAVDAVDGRDVVVAYGVHLLDRQILSARDNCQWALVDGFMFSSIKGSRKKRADTLQTIFRAVCRYASGHDKILLGTAVQWWAYTLDRVFDGRVAKRYRSAVTAFGAWEQVTEMPGFPSFAPWQPMPPEPIFQDSDSNDRLSQTAPKPWWNFW